MKSVLITLETSPTESYCTKTDPRVVFRFSPISSMHNYINSKIATSVFRATDEPTCHQMSATGH